jgi:hypothetical protein
MALLLSAVVAIHLLIDEGVFSEASYFNFFPVLSCFHPYLWNGRAITVAGFRWAL